MDLEYITQDNMVHITMTTVKLEDCDYTEEGINNAQKSMDENS